MVFLPASLTRAANDFVKAQPVERNPRFPRKDFGGAVMVGGNILRYSTTSAPRTDR